MIMHAIRPELNGKDVGPMQDPSGKAADTVLRSSEDVRAKTTDIKGRIERFLERVRAT
jgi:hypothetical protein